MTQSHTIASQVSLTPDALTRFPDLAGRTGIVMESDPGGWTVVRWNDGGGRTWVPGWDLEKPGDGK